MLIATYMKLAGNGEGQIEATHALAGDAAPGEPGHAYLTTVAERAAVRGFWLDHKTFIPPAALVRLEILENP
jgi:hypothetical protein